MTAPVLKVNALCKSFGGVRAIRDLTFEVRAGEILGLIGPNGSGKSTTVNSLAGIFPITSGSLQLDGVQVDGMPEHSRVAGGLARTFQTASIFAEFTVREQILLGSNVTRTSHPLSSVFSIGRKVDEEAALEKRVAHILEITGLTDVEHKRVATISSAQQRFLMIATALASDTKVVLLDEPAAGLDQTAQAALDSLIATHLDDGGMVMAATHTPLGAHAHEELALEATP